MGDEKVYALAGINLSVAVGEFIAIAGPSGSGKSTMMNTLGCLDLPTSGKYLLNGIDVTGLSDDSLSQLRARYIGFVFQNYNLLARESALANVALPLNYSSERPRSERKKLARAALEKVGLGHRSKHKPSELSGGEQQRVGIARALIKNPKVLLADEPTGNLDTRTSKGLMELFLQLNNEGITIIMVTHDPEIARIAHRIITFRDGLIEKD
ncbi:MAG: ABC transporter ATP-binding protein [SAR202 cluster bacterium]|nr:ABC transporter ATP-binding protein [Dehalococcoidia bacterium]MDP7613401.1 ABC transporter ATP-binding protein [Dehalococcoidia bacterium]MQG47425.1 ABC transporter ATP-binding protein [SAR202 cluster bacterium]